MTPDPFPPAEAEPKGDVRLCGAAGPRMWSEVGRAKEPPDDAVGGGSIPFDEKFWTMLRRMRSAQWLITWLGMTTLLVGKSWALGSPRSHLIGLLVGAAGGGVLAIAADSIVRWLRKHRR